MYRDKYRAFPTCDARLIQGHMKHIQDPVEQSTLITNVILTCFCQMSPKQNCKNSSCKLSDIITLGSEMTHGSQSAHSLKKIYIYIV